MFVTTSSYQALVEPLLLGFVHRDLLSPRKPTLRDQHLRELLGLSGSFSLGT